MKRKVCNVSILNPFFHFPPRVIDRSWPIPALSNGGPSTKLSNSLLIRSYSLLPTPRFVFKYLALIKDVNLNVSILLFAHFSFAKVDVLPHDSQTQRHGEVDHIPPWRRRNVSDLIISNSLNLEIITRLMLTKILFHLTGYERPCCKCLNSRRRSCAIRRHSCTTERCAGESFKAPCTNGNPSIHKHKTPKNESI